MNAAVLLLAAMALPFEAEATFSNDVVGPCCVFHIDITRNGMVRSKVIDVPVRVTEARLSDDKRSKLLAAIESVRFFELPESIGAIMMHDEERQMTVRVGERKREVVIHGSCSDPLFPEDKRDPLRRRACALWGRLRALLNDPKVTVP